MALGSSLAALEPPWVSPNRCRILVRVDPRGVRRSSSPVSLEVDLAAALRDAGLAGEPDEDTLEVVAHDDLSVPAVFDGSRQGYERHLLPWRLERIYGAARSGAGAARSTLHFVLPDEKHTLIAVYLDTVDCRRGQPGRYPGPVGDGDFFREERHTRDIGASRFDAFADLDGDGDLDLFRGGVEPYLYAYENAGGNRLVERGRLSSGGAPLELPHGAKNGRSWVVPCFHDLDGDRDQDLFASFMDGPHARRVIRFENTTAPGGALTFADRGPLKTAAGTPIGGGAQEGGWFPSITFVEDFERDGDGRPDLLLGSNGRCYFYRNLGSDGAGGWRWAEAEALRAGGAEITLGNPCFAAADIDGDRDQDLFAAPQSGEILFYENVSAAPPAASSFAKGAVIAYDHVYTIRSTHPRVTIADFTGDGLLDLVLDRAWRLADLRSLSDHTEYGALLANAGSAASPKWQRAEPATGAPRSCPHTGGFQICDALRQNVVRATDWDEDGKLDLLAGDCDGFIWLFRNRTGRHAPLFERGRRLEAGGKVLSLAANGAHARPDVCDWNGDGRQDLVVASGDGTAVLFLNEGAKGAPRLGAGRAFEVEEEGQGARPLQRGTRAHVLVSDWNGDGRQDLVWSDQDSRRYCVFEGKGSELRLAPARTLDIEPCVRPNLGSFADWDGDGKKDLIACEFEQAVRLYRNAGSGAPGEEPRFADPRGSVLLQPASIMMISGVDAIDWNGDGDLDLLTGQGHGGSGLRFFERDFIEDELRGTRPLARIERVEAGRPDFLEVVRGYAAAMLERGRDVYGERQSGLFLSALDRGTLAPLEMRPSPPGGIRREDRAGLPWRRLSGANPHLDQNLLRALYCLSELTGEGRFQAAADAEVKWFFENAQSPVTGLLAWGEHLSWDVFLDRPISSGTELIHEFARPWALWERSWELAPEACRRFALGLWQHQIADAKTGAFDRHAIYDRHAPRDGMDFPRHAGFYVATWAHAYRHTQDETLLRAIEALLARFERKRTDASGVQHSTFGPLDLEEAAGLVPDPLRSRLRGFAEAEDRLILDQLRKENAGPGGAWRFRPTWQSGYSSGTTADWAMFALARWDQVKKDEFRELVVAVADAYVDALPDEDVDVWPLSMAHVISAEAAAYRFSGKPVYLAEACRLARFAVRAFWEDRPIPRASFKTGHYETITGGDSLALALLEVHVLVRGLETRVPSNTIDR